MPNPVVQELFADDQSVEPLESTVRRAGRLRRLVMASLALHLLGVTAIWIYPLLAMAIGLRNIQYIDADYNRAILIDFSQKLKYPAGYSGFRPPDDKADLQKALEKLREEERRRKREEERRARVEARRRAVAESKTGTDDEQKAGSGNKPDAPAKQGDADSDEMKLPAGFRPINTRPIREQLERLYEAKKDGRLVFDENNIKIGVAGRILADGRLVDYKLIVPSGNRDIDRAAMAILDSVSESRALGPLSQLSSLSLILEIGAQAELRVVGFAGSEKDAVGMAQLANLALAMARISKASDPNSMVLLNNIRVSHTGQRVQAIVSMTRQKAIDAMVKSMEKGAP
ncbi:MAG: hypothetical protein ACKV2V_01765 [Blastocatellia bacterium]